MSAIPGWDSITGAGWWTNFHFWASIVALILLGVFEVFSHRYGERHDELVALEQTETKRRHEEEMARLHLEASQADEKAAKATEEAAKLGVSFGNLHDFVADQERRNNAVIDELKRDAAGLNKARDDALAAAEGTKKTLADMSSLLEKQRALQQQMIESTRPRDLSAEQQSTLIENLKKFKGMVVNVVRFQSSTPDSPPLANLLVGLFGKANWTVRGVAVSTGGGYAHGVIVVKRADAGPMIGEAAATLIRQLNTLHIGSGPAPDFAGNGASILGGGMVTGFDGGPPFPDIIVVVGDKV